MAGTYEIYLRSIQSGNLRTDPNRITSIDVVTAAGFSGNRPGLIFLRLKSEYDCHGGRASAAALTGAHRALALACRRMSHEDSDRVSAKVLSWWLDRSCRACEGRGRILANSTRPIRSCVHCRGTGELRPPFGELGRSLVSYIESKVALARDAVGRSLHGG